MSIDVCQYNEPFLSRWYAALKQRRSHRRFSPSKPIPADIIERLHTICSNFRPFPNARARLITETPEAIFKGAIGPYGRVKGASAFIAFIGDMRSPCVQEQVGYTGEGIVLEATSLGLATCWVGGFFRQDMAASLAGISESERVLAVTPVGYAVEMPSFEEKLMTGFGYMHRRNSVSGMVTGLSQDDWAGWVRSALQAARLAPSAINRQPWGFHIEPESITVHVRTKGPEFNISKRLDCGIAMLHIELAAMSLGLRGGWDFLEAPQVARFTIQSAR